MEILTKIATSTWTVFFEAAPYMILGLFAAMLIYAFFPKDRIQSLLGKPGMGSILKASLLGIPLPLCSCGVLPTALSLRDRGASKGATVSFLVSTPETGLDSMAVTYALINPAMTILRPVSAFVSSVVAGFGVDRFDRKHPSPEPVKEESGCCCCSSKAPVVEARPTLIQRFRASVHYIVVDFFPDIANWLLLGFVLSGIVAALLPAEFLLGIPPTTQLLLAVVAGVPIYICASASTPIAAVLLMKGLSPGAALVFLLVGPATNLASLLVLGRRLGTRTAAIYLASLAITALVIGFAVNAFMGGWNWVPNIASPHVHEHTGWRNWVGAALLICGFLYVWSKSIFSRFQRTTTDASETPSSQPSAAHAHQG